MDVIIADAAPLRRLALANILNVLPQVGGRVRMADMTAFEAAQQVDEPGARHLRDWLAAGQVAGSSRVSVEETSAGQLFILARQVDPALCARRSGRTAAIDWLALAGGGCPGRQGRGDGDLRRLVDGTHCREPGEWCRHGRHVGWLPPARTLKGPIESPRKQEADRKEVAGTACVRRRHRARMTARRLPSI